MKTFVLIRDEDESGISGTGTVAEGVQFSNGRCVLSWMTQFKSMSIYESIEDIKAVHGHFGKTRIVFDSRNEILNSLAQTVEYFPDDLLKDVIDYANYLVARRNRAIK